MLANVSRNPATEGTEKPHIRKDAGGCCNSRKTAYGRRLHPRRCGQLGGCSPASSASALRMPEQPEWRQADHPIGLHFDSAIIERMSNRSRDIILVLIPKTGKRPRSPRERRLEPCRHVLPVIAAWPGSHLTAEKHALKMHRPRPRPAQFPPIKLMVIAPIRFGTCFSPQYPQTKAVHGDGTGDLLRDAVRHAIAFISVASRCIGDKAWPDAGCIADRPALLSGRR